MARHNRAAAGGSVAAGAVAALMAVAGVALVLVALLTWTATRRAVDPARFTNVSIDARRSPSGPALIADELTRQVGEGARQRGVTLPRTVSDTLIPEAVATTVTSPHPSSSTRSPSRTSRSSSASRTLIIG